MSVRPRTHTDIIPRLFVYGTLAPGRVNEHILTPISGTWEPATVRGWLYPQGWGATLGFPALVLDEAGEIVAGQLFTSDELNAHWERLDAFEGKAYQRVVAQVTRSDQTVVDAYLYALRPSDA